MVNMTAHTKQMFTVFIMLKTEIAEVNMNHITLE